MFRRPPSSTPFPYTTLFRSGSRVRRGSLVVIPVGRALLYSEAIYLRSEEHTSELQSRRDLVCRLLLEKKKNKRSSSHTKRHNTRAAEQDQQHKSCIKRTADQ